MSVEGGVGFLGCEKLLSLFLCGVLANVFNGLLGWLLLRDILGRA